MRQVFTSQRIENVEGVARLLRDAGIEVRINNSRSYRGAIRGNFSYREQAMRSAQPEVWVLRSDDYPRARQLLREAGLEQRGHSVGGGFAGVSMYGAASVQAGAPPRAASRARRGALLVVALAVAAGYFAMRWSASSAPRQPAVPAAAATSGAPLIADTPSVHRQQTPPALAAMLVATELRSLPASARACVSVDGAPHPADIASGALEDRVASGDACMPAMLRVAVGDYLTDGSGIGTVRVQVSSANAPPRARTLEVERTGRDWTVLRTLPADGP